METHSSSSRSSSGSLPATFQVPIVTLLKNGLSVRKTWASFTKEAQTRSNCFKSNLTSFVLIYCRRSVSDFPLLCLNFWPFQGVPRQKRFCDLKLQLSFWWQIKIFLFQLSWSQKTIVFKIAASNAINNGFRLRMKLNDKQLQKNQQQRSSTTAYIDKENEMKI